MSILTQNDLKIQSPIPIMDIQKFHMEIYKNTHAVFYIEGIISEEEGEEVVLQPLSGTTVMISANNQTLFVGYYYIIKECE